MPDQEDPRIPPQVQDRRLRPTGVLPKNTQAWVISGLALLMIVIIALSGKNTPKEKLPAPESQLTDPNAGHIQEYETRLKAEAQQLDTAKAQLAHTQQALGIVPAPMAASLPASPGFLPEARVEEGSAASEHRTHEEQSLFASNVALSFRKEATGATATSAPPTPADVVAKALANYAPAAAAPPARANAAAEDESPLKEETEARAKAAHAAERDAEIDRAEGHRYRLFEGTVLEAILTNRLDGTFSGPVNCMVTGAVYSHNGRHLLVPQGTRLLGEARKVETFGESRLAVTFHRMIMPDGYSTSLDKLQGLNQIGETGLQDQVNHHYLQVFGVSLAIGAIAGLSQANTAYGANESAADAYRQGMASSLSQTSVHILDRYLNVLPTVTIREGHRVKVYLSDDLLLPAYDNHRMPGDL